MPADKSPKGFFVTGTDTGVGKTTVAAALAFFLQNRGYDVGVMKPVETGVENPERLGADADILKWAAGSSDPADLVSPYRLRAPLAPSLAAEKENIRIDFSGLVETAKLLASRHDLLLVEGAGGLMVPLAGGLLVADLARQIGLPLLIVCRAALGTVNHTLLTIHAARTMELPVAGFIINGMSPHPDEAEEGAPHLLSSLASSSLLGVLNRAEGNALTRTESLAKQIGQLPTLPWLLNTLKLSA